MPTLQANIIGRWGNALFQYAHCKAWCVQNGWTLQTDPWIGERIFEIQDERPCGKPDRVFTGYAQDQDSIIYSRKQCREWFQFRPEIKASLWSLPAEPLLAHRRKGDYADCGYVVVSMESHLQACEKFGLNVKDLKWVSEESPQNTKGFPPELSFLEDFGRMMQCDTLLRGNSSFSWWAATLGECRVFSPVIEGLEGGHVEKTCEFVEGNWPRLANLDFTTNLHMFKDEDRYNYPLNENSVVIDAGGYEGQFADEIIKRFNCYLLVLEPSDHFDVLSVRYAPNKKVETIKACLGGSHRNEFITTKGSMTGMFADGEQKTRVPVMDIAGVIGSLPVEDKTVDLLKLNIEGMEFEVMERLLDSGTVKQVKNIQVQFHGVVPDAQARYAKIRERMMATHRLTYDEPWCWENYERRDQ